MVGFTRAAAKRSGSPTQESVYFSRTTDGPGDALKMMIRMPQSLLQQQQRQRQQQTSKQTRPSTLPSKHSKSERSRPHTGESLTSIRSSTKANNVNRLLSTCVPPRRRRRRRRPAWVGSWKRAPDSRPGFAPRSSDARSRGILFVDTSVNYSLLLFRSIHHHFMLAQSEVTQCNHGT